MTQVDEGRSRAAAARLLEAANPDVYRRNPFRVTGVATDAPARRVRQERQRVLNVLDLMPDATVGDQVLPLPSRPAPDEVRAAFDALQRPDQRVIDELFWWWGEPGECGCEPEVHTLHDIAVRAHTEALDLEAAPGSDDPEARSERWVDVADAWADALDAPGFWAHVRHRVTALADRRLGESTVDGLRGAMARALMNPQVLLARKPGNGVLARLLDTWDVDAEVIDNARADAAAPVYEAVEAQLTAVGDLRDDTAPLTAARRALSELPDLARTMEALVPHERFRRSATLRNRISVMLNNCALPIRDSSAKPTVELKQALFEYAIELAVEAEDQRIIRDNLDDLLAAQRFRQAGGSLATSPWDQVNTLIRTRRVDDAIKLLRRMRDTETRPERRAEIESALAQLTQARAVVGGGQPAPWRWMTTLGLFLAAIAAVVYLTDVTWHLDMWLVMAGGAVATLVLTFFVCTTGYRMSIASNPLVGLLTLAIAGYAVWEVQTYGLAPFWMALAGFTIPLEITLPAGLWLAQKWNTR